VAGSPQCKGDSSPPSRRWPWPRPRSPPLSAPSPGSPSWGTQYTGPSSVVSKEEKEPRDDQDGEGCSTTEGGSMKLQFRVFSRSWWATARARNRCQCPWTPTLAGRVGCCAGPPCPTRRWVLGTGAASQAWGRLSLRIPARSPSQAPARRGHQPATAVTSIPRAWDDWLRTEEPVQALQPPFIPPPQQVSSSQIKDARGGGTSCPNPWSHEGPASIPAVTRELHNPARPPCKGTPGTATVPFQGKEMLTLIALISTSASLFVFSFPICSCKR